MERRAEVFRVAVRPATSPLMNPVVIHGAPSWPFSSDRVEAAITCTGGHLAPVRFHLADGPVEPFAISPWTEEAHAPDLPAMLRILRGDFFCGCFGGNETPHEGERHPPHGETANNLWRFRSLQPHEGRMTLHLDLALRVRSGHVDKFIELRPGETAIYSRHVVSGLSGRLNPGHHAMLRFPATPGSGRISTSAIRYGQVVPGMFEDPARGGYTSLQPGATFSGLDRVPAANGGHADASRYPARDGFEDLLMVAHESRPDFAWSAVTFPEQGYVWFALKDPRILRSTVFWFSNGGRHYPPWNGRHRRVLGVEDATTYFHLGLSESAQANDVNRAGFATTLAVSAPQPLVVNYIMAVAAIPRQFERVQEIVPHRDRVELVSTGGDHLSVRVDPAWRRLRAAQPPT